MNRRFAGPWRGVAFPSRAGASGSHHLPWALPRVLHARAKGKRLHSRSAAGDGCDSGIVCSKGASRSFKRDKRASGIAASSAGRKRGNGRGGKRSRSTGRRLAASRDATGKAAATGNGSRAAKQPSQRRLASPRG